MKRLWLSFLLTLISLSLVADEGMWLPSLISKRIVDMQQKGFKLSAEDIYSVNQASLKDAVVLFGGGCTGELISGKGLLLTNHHCGYSRIQKHSSVEHDYLKDGFWAMNMKEELPNPGLTVSFLDRMEDVTDQVLSGRDPKEIAKEATDKDKGLEASVEALYYGNQYFLFVFRVFSDIRLVGAPPSSIGKFGGDTDNWMWPRHTGDFSLFRVYADKNNNPAPYSPDNIPYTPKKFFKISTKGVKEGDFTFIYGFPGSTREYITSEAVKFIVERSNPHKIMLRTHRLNAQREFMSKDQKIRIMYSSKNANVSNAWKKWQGELKGVLKNNTIQRKQDYEVKFEEWAKGGKYEGVVPKINALYTVLSDYAFALDYYREAIAAIEYPAFIMGGKKNEEAFYKDYYQPIDKQCFISLVKEYVANVPEAFRPPYASEKINQYGSVEGWADVVFSNEAAALEFAQTFSNFNKENILPVYNKLNELITLLYKDYMKGQMEFEKHKEFYPDANLTLRVAYGKVQGYTPADGIYYYPSSTIEGIMQKDNPEIFDYDIPQKLRDIYAKKDYGRWAVNGTIPVCFIATNHTTGGNSGSPIINGDGNLIGINFDRVWEGTMSDIQFDPEICRNISLDVRYVLFIIDRLAGATWLFNEMVFVSK